MVTLRPLTHEDLQLVRKWRNATRESLRTPYLLTEAMQDRFAADVIDNPASPHRYFAIGTTLADLVGMGGLSYIGWVEGIAEISLIIDPAQQGNGYGRAAVQLLLDEAFGRLRLLTVVGEAYRSNARGIRFWETVTRDYGAYTTTLPRRKWWDGRLWDSLHFTITAEAWAQRRRAGTA